MSEPRDKIIAALDLGTSLTKVVLARPISEYEVEIIGTGAYPSSGVKNGSIINIESTTRSIVEAISEAELTSGQEISMVAVNITGKTVRADNSKGVVAITNRDRTVTEPDVVRVIEAAQAIRVPADQQILHVLSKEFSVDDQTSIRDPIGMTGVRLEAEVHIVTAGITAIHNLEKCIESSGLACEVMILSSLASSEAVLTSGEKDLGTAVLDIGAGICDLIVYVDGGISYSSVIPFGGINVTSDISIGLKTTLETAELLKKRYGHTVLSEIDPTETIEIPPISGRPARQVLREELVSIIEPRMREIFEMTDKELEKSGKKGLLAGGVILTGGGSLLEGIDTLAEDVFRLTVSRARPGGISGLAEKASSPEFSTVIGMIKYADRMTDMDQKSVDRSEGWSKKIRRWIEDNL
ncbi:cell division protein FtsA [Leptospira borgpetersenii]|uniref:Cell division protein FtsA n=1 Tax=Leptospira borgpetersenii serovar Ballum TaxID=280505 RepID=A0A0E3B4K7_LEPBO|nr:cell division protein FtsA [Leptospira borgpetersenii]ALO26026.1 cell division protein FtsA [Leptospira borgpetersenii serovar Ballum]ANH00790.1 Cell division protein FtsA [Leptospira borgpetersenii str. 4E]EKR01971.1 cell division protein FtsA [Leptospira borgpetersenii serovar Castellonis str. 200801910]KGE22311.1 cell division protein FtsA [Leptospira borgpetersenii serovar Ballum]MBE8160435.1 cell division protein FtsA [Leptospira borgpetersenii serovar Ballum]